MQIPIIRRGGLGGIDLNFEIVGDTIQPNNPSENTIWVNTEIEITEWVFSIEEPSPIIDGMVWIKISTNGAFALDAINNEDKLINLYFNLAKQRIGDTWVNKEAYIFQDATWKELLAIKNLYLDGTEYVTWTGANGGTGTGTTTKQATALYTKAIYSSGTNGKYASFYTPSTVDISEYKTLKAEVNMTNRAQEAGLYIADTAAKAKQVSYSKSLSYHRLYYGTDKAGEYTLSINLANVTTKQVYIGIGVISGVGDDTGAMTVSRIWLE